MDLDEEITLSQKVGRREKLAQIVGRREIYSPVFLPPLNDFQVFLELKYEEQFKLKSNE